MAPDNSQEMGSLPEEFYFGTVGLTVQVLSTIFRPLLILNSGEIKRNANAFLCKYT